MIRGRQRSGVQLPVHRHWQPVQHDDGRRDHKLRQVGGGVVAEHGGIDGCTGAGDDVGDDVLLAGGIFASDHGSLGDAGVAGQGGGDLSSLDVEPADLDLAISTPGEHQLPILPAARSPVRYIRAPATPNGHATNRCAVSPGRFR